MAKKKKVGIVTWVHHGLPNYGQLMQSYAMQSLIYELEHEPIILRWRWKDGKDGLKHYFSNKYVNYLYEVWYHYHGWPDFSKRSLRYDFFIHRYLKQTPVCYNFTQIREELSDCDVLLAGSDQIWNPYLFQPIFYLAFANKNQRRISYAPSLAVYSDEGLEAEFTSMGNLIDCFHKVSVREESSVQLLSKYTKNEITCVIDPTLLISRDKWLRLVKKRLVKESYIFCLLYGKVDPHIEKINSICRQYNSDKIVYVPYGDLQKISYSRLKNSIGFDNASPQDYLSLIKYSDVVITTSFHCVNFSLQFEKDFYAAPIISKPWFLKVDNRVTELLKSVDLLDRDISLENDVQKRHIDYSRVNEKISGLRKESRKFFEEALN